eukprot:Em0011g165a
MASPHLLLLMAALSGLRWTLVTAGLQVYFYRYPPGQYWQVEGLATWINTNSFSQNLDCSTTSNSGDGVGWTRQAGLLPNWVQAVTNGKRLSLDFGFTNADLGIYTCYDIATNESLNVNITNANPAIQAVSDVVIIEAGSSGQLKVYVSGFPDPTSADIAWFKVGPGENTTELKEPTVNFSSDHRTLLLTNVQDSDGGTYKCIVTQSFPLNLSSSAIMQLAINAGPDSNTTTSSTTDAISIKRVVIAFVFVVIGTFLIAMCLSVVIILCLLKRRKTKRHSLSMMQGIRLQSCTSGPTIEDIDPHDDVFTGPSVSNTQPKSFPRDQRGSGSTSSTKGLLEAHDARPSSTEGGARLPAIKEDAPTEPPPSEGARYSLPTEEHMSSAVPHYMLITPRGPTPLSSHHHTPSVNPTAANSAQYADLMPVPYLTPSLLTITTSASQSSQPELDPVGPIIGLSPRPWYENSNSSLRQVGIQDDIQPYATTSNLSIPLDPVAERTWGPPPPRPPSPLPGSQVPLPYMDPAPLRQTLERSSRHRSLSPVMSTGDLV